MADRISVADGLLTAAGTWAVADTTSKLVSNSAASTALTTLAQDSAAFAPGAITVDGIALKVASRAAGAPSNTITVTLRNSTDGLDVASVTANVSAIDECDTTQRNGGWYFFKFSASQLLAAGKNYVVRVLLSSTSTAVSLETNGVAANWQRLLRTTTTGAPAAGDDLYLVGELDGATNPATETSRVVTMDSTAATDYGAASTDQNTPGFNINKRATLTYQANAATNYVLRLSTVLRVFSGGTLSIGTTGTPIPRDSTAVLEFDCAADGDFGLYVDSGGIWNAQGLSRSSGKNVVSCKLNTDEAIGQTVLGVDTDTGWLNGDEIVIAATTRTKTETEQKILNGAAGATSLTITVALAAAHSGTAPTQAEVILLTRNVKVRSVSATFMSYVNCKATSTNDLDWVEFKYIGSGAAGGKSAVRIETTTGTFTADFCSNWLGELYGFEALNGAGGFTLNDCVTWQNHAASTEGFRVTTSGTTFSNWTLNRCIAMGGGAAGFNFNDLAGTMTTLTAVACTVGITAIETAASNSFGTMSGWTAHSCSSTGINITQTTLRNATMSSFTAWRNNGTGIIFASASIAWCTFADFTAFGNVNVNIAFGNAQSLIGVWDVLFRNLDVDGDTSFSVATGLQFSFNASGAAVGIRIDNSAFGVVGGIKTTHTSGDINLGSIVCEVILRDTVLASASEILNTTAAVIRRQRLDGTAATHRTVFPWGQIDYETGTFRTASPSEKLSPSSTTFKLKSGSKRAPIRSGQAATFGVYVRKNAAYNGAAPRLILKANPAIGLDSDTVLATHSAAADTWQLLSGASAAVNDDGVCEVLVDCDGAAGAVFVDDWAAPSYA